MAHDVTYAVPCRRNDVMRIVDRPVTYANDVINTKDDIYVKKRHLCGRGHLCIKA